MRVVLTGGGSKGHVLPLGPILEALRTRFLSQQSSLPRWIEPEVLDVYFLGVADPAGRDFFQRHEVTVIMVPSGKLRRYASGRTLVDLLFRLPLGIFWALVQMWRVMPDVVISKGGYGSFPIVLAAAVYRIPVVLHESDAIVGLANRSLLRFATAVAVGFNETKETLGRYAYKGFVIGTPVRAEFDRVTIEEARQVFGISEQEKVLLVMGGSQGAEQVNETLLKVLPELIKEVTVIHLTGVDHFSKVTTIVEELLATSARKMHYKAFPYLSDTMPHAMMVADVVISRAGATTLAELAHLRKPALLIPLEGAANDHQRQNASIFEKQGAARVLDPVNVKRTLFLRNVQDLLHNNELRHQLSSRIGQLDNPQAAATLAELVLTLACGVYPTQSK